MINKHKINIISVFNSLLTPPEQKLENLSKQLDIAIKELKMNKEKKQ